MYLELMRRNEIGKIRVNVNSIFSLSLFLLHMYAQRERRKFVEGSNEWNGPNYLLCKETLNFGFGIEYSEQQMPILKLDNRVWRLSATCLLYLSTMSDDRHIL